MKYVTLVQNKSFSCQTQTRKNMNTNTEIRNSRTDKPSQPIDSFLQEAENLYEWCKDDVPKLETAGISAQMIEELPMRTDLCRDAQSKWVKIKGTPGKSKKEWHESLPQALELRRELINGLRFAFRKHSDLLQTLKIISKGDSYSDLIQDLSDISVVGKENSGLLLSIDFNLSLLDDAATKSEELALLWAKTNAEKNERLNYKIHRNESFWHLKELVTEIRAVGKFVFRNDKNRLKGYSSIFWKRKNSKKKITLNKDNPDNTL